MLPAVNLPVKTFNLTAVTGHMEETESGGWERAYVITTTCRPALGSFPCVSFRLVPSYFQIVVSQTCAFSSDNVISYHTLFYLHISPRPFKLRCTLNRQCATDINLYSHFIWGQWVLHTDINVQMVFSRQISLFVLCNLQFCNLLSNTLF